MIRLLALALCLLAWPGAAVAHKPSDSYLTIGGEPDALTVRWDIALRDLDHALGLDGDGDGAVTWGELRARHGAIASYSLARLKVSGDGAPCPPGPVEHLVDRHSDGAYAVLRFPLACPQAPARLTVRYDLLFDLDPQHRGLLSLVAGGSAAAVLAPDQRAVTLTLGRFGPAEIASFFLDGLHHLLGGPDHLLFLVVLLLPAVLGGGDGAAALPLRASLIGIAQILTAFTLGHALTLSASVLGVLALPARAVEVAIALSIALTALDNLWPCLGSRRWLIAGGFGLVHGLGFAGALGPLDLAPAALALALLAFNLGIEAAQIGLALILLPLGRLLPLRRRPELERGLQGAGSAAAMALALLWLMDRAFDLGLMPI
jgi:hypothetical protein